MYRILIFIVLVLVFSSCARGDSLWNDQEGKVGNSVRVEDFGAIPNDNKDDSDAIQSAIDHALCNNLSRITAGPGIFNLSRGVVIAKQCNAAKMTFATIHLSGYSGAYDSNQRLGETTVFRVASTGFTLAIQKIRNSSISNIVFQGKYEGAKDIKSIMNHGPGLRSDEVHNPNCAIAIDPFHSKTPKKDRYSGYDQYYTSNSNSGSSMLTITGCSFLDLRVAIANNPSLGVNNGDNIKIEDSHVKRCHTFWACGQTQSRANTIENIYSINVHTFIDGRSIGAGQGTPPNIVNCNLAGFTKYVLNLQSGFSGMNVYRSYMESIWSLGVSLMNVTSFDQCQVKFHIPKEDDQVSPFNIYSNGLVSFRDCSLEYFSNCNYRASFFLKSKELILDGCHVEGGLPVSAGYTNRGGERLHNVRLNTVNVKCLGATAGKSWHIKPKVNTNKDILLGGEIQITTEGDTLVNTRNTYIVNGLSDCRMKYIANNRAILSTPSIDQAKVYDNIFSEFTMDLSEWGLPDYDYRPSIGFIDEIKDGQYVLRATLPNIKESLSYLYTVRWSTMSSSHIKKVKR